MAQHPGGSARIRAVRRDVDAVVVLLILYETVRFAEARREERSHLHEHGAS